MHKGQKAEISRRKFTLAAIVAVGGGAKLTACQDNVVLSPVAGSGEGLRFYTASEHLLLKRLGDLMIPETDTPGALSVGVADMMDKLMAGWASQKTKDAQKETIRKIEADLNQRVGSKFVNVPRNVAYNALNDYDQKAFEIKTSMSDYRSLKFLIETVYASSEKAIYEEYQDDPVPGMWEPQVELKAF